MKGLFWADVHVEHSVRGDNIKGEMVNNIVLDELAKHAKGEKPDFIFILGDLLDEHGIIESSLAVYLRQYFLNLADEINENRNASGLNTPVKIIFLTGNHEYQETKEEYFGKGSLQAIFGGMEEFNFHVIDEFAKFIRLDEKHVILGKPYRETWDQYEKSCYLPIQKALEAGEANPKNDKIITGWHVGIPWSQSWHDGEYENNWIKDNHPALKMSFDISFDQRIYCGHYHGPGDTACGKIGTFTYIGSPATRSRSESEQVKRVGIWEDGKVSFYETGIILDKIVTSIDAAKEFQNLMVKRFGDGILRISNIFIDLGDGASRDDFNVARLKASKLPGNVRVITPNLKRQGICDHIVEKHKNDPNSSRAQLEQDMVLFSVVNHFNNKDFKLVNEALAEALTKLSYRKWKEAARGSEESIKEIKTFLLGQSYKEEDLPEITAEFCERAASLSLTYELSKQITTRV